MEAHPNHAGYPARSCYKRGRFQGALSALSLILAINAGTSVASADQAQEAWARQEQRAVAMRRALSGKIPFSEVTITRLEDTDANADIYEPQLYIRFNEHGVTMQASQVRLERLLQDLCWQGGFDLDARLSLSELASVTMHDASLTHVLSTLLREYSYVLTREANGKVSKLVVMARDEEPLGEGLIREISDRRSPMPTPTVADYLAQTDKNLRRNLLRAQSAETSEQAVAFLQSVVEVESDVSIRRQALDLLEQHPSATAVTALAELALDSKSIVRLEAAQKLVRRDQAEAMQVLGNIAFSDPDQNVRQRALALLDQMPNHSAKQVWASAMEELPVGPGGRVPQGVPQSVPVSLPGESVDFRR